MGRAFSKIDQSTQTERVARFITLRFSPMRYRWRLSPKSVGKHRFAVKITKL
jgi:hypothetical protein